jgi:polyphosphate glucokinase
MEVLGIDIGGSGIKGAPVDVAKAELTQERLRIPTPIPSTPEAVASVVGQIAKHFAWDGLIGVTYPGVVVDGVTRSAANVDKGWIGTDARGLFARATGLPVTVLNDADAAGLAEVAAGAAQGKSGVVIVLTFGTGIGSALLIDGKLVPNTELGHLEIDGGDAEKRASSAAKDNEGLSYKQWAKRVQRYLSQVEKLFTPDLFVVGGGVSKNSDKWVPMLDLNTPVRPAQLLNNAGIVGAAMAAHEKFTE